MKQLFNLFFVFFFSLNASAQEGWFWQHPLPQGNSLTDIYVFDQNTAIAVGHAGTIIKTTDGGITWSFQSIDTKNNLSSVHFIDANIGWTVGNSGSIFKTTDGGASWYEQTSGTFDWLNSVHFVNANIGWAVGLHNRIIKTIDGGNQWICQHSENLGELYSVYFVDENIGWTVGGSGFTQTILKTSDGGTNWIAQSSQTTKTLYSVYFINSNIGWAVGVNNILKTTDGGTTWDSIPDIPLMSSIKSICFMDENLGWAVGSKSILKTTNGGLNWQEFNCNSSGSLSSVSFFNASSGWIVGDIGTIVKTIDGGDSWIIQDVRSIDASLASAYFQNINIGWIVGTNGAIYKTTNGGDQWNEQVSGTSKDLNSVYFVSSTHGWIVGESGTILSTLDGGANWITQTSGTTKELCSIFFVDINTGWTVGETGTVLKTLDGGLNWNSIFVGISKKLKSVYFTDYNTGWAVGSESSVLKTTDGGNNWSAKSLGITLSLNSVFFLDENIGWTVGDGYYSIIFPDIESLIYKTNDGGINWLRQESNILSDLNSVFFTDYNTGWAVGSSGTIRFTNDGGTTWRKQECKTLHKLMSVRFVDSNHGWIVGSAGAILKTTDGGGGIMPTANFTADQTNGEAPLTVQFTSHSSGDITSWDWNFGDNQTSTEQNPVHTYQQAGVFTVSLTVTGPAGSDTQTRTDYITVTETERFLTHDTGNLQVSIFDNGNIGHLGISGSGDGVKFKGGADALFSSGIILGTAARKSVNGHIGSFSISDDLVNVAPITGFETLPPHWDQVAKTTFNDTGSPNPYGISVKQISYSKTGDNGVVILYRLYGVSSFINDLYVGVFADWDVGGDAFGSNLGGYDTARNMAYQYVSGGTNDANYYGFVALNGLAGARVTSEWVNEGVRDSSFNWISTFLNEPISTPNDYRMWIGSGPFSLTNNDSLDVYFALVAGTNLSKLQSNADVIIEKHHLFTPVEKRASAAGIIQNYRLYQNYPNPFNSSTIFRFNLPKASFVTLKIYNLLGKEIETLVKRHFSSGAYEINWDTKKFPSGLYFYRMEAGEFSQTKKLIIQK